LTYDDLHNKIFWQNTSGFAIILEALVGTIRLFTKLMDSIKSAPPLGPNGAYNGGNDIYDPTNGTINRGDIYRTQREAEGHVN